jgi:hypothetical protein
MQSEPRPPAALPAGRATRPALLYVLAAFGVVAGGYGSLGAVTTGLSLLAPRDVFVQAIRERNQTPPQTLVPKADIERFSDREGEARYARRNAALPLAVVGVILSCLLFAGCTRTMMGDAWGLGAWALAATASIPYQLIATALNLVTLRDIGRAIAELPLSPLLTTRLQVERIASLVLSGMALVYFGACILYLRVASVRGGFSDGRGRTPPSA